MDETEHIIYIALLDEDVDAWRPVRAKRVSEDVFLVIEQPYDRAIETWQFEPGTEVICQPRKLSDGLCLVAVDRRR